MLSSRIRFLLPLLSRVLLLSWRRSESLRSFLFIVRYIFQRLQLARGQSILKFRRYNGKIYFDLFYPGYPGKPFDQNINWILDQHIAPQGVSPRFVMLSITKKCPLNCKHCYEWDHLHQPETMSHSEWIDVFEGFERTGTTHFLLGGGEPLMNLQLVHELLEKKSDYSQVWIVTSGYGINYGKIKELKDRGLDGILFSVDHFSRSRHNSFRGSKIDLFQSVMEAVHACKKLDILTGFSLCTTREFLTDQNLDDYMKLAYDCGVNFVQLLEPRAEGRYANQDVELSEEQFLILDNAYKKYQADRRYKDYPILSHTSYGQRRVGCLGAGNRYCLVDSDGKVHSCPFCRNSKKVDALELLAKTDASYSLNCDKYSVFRNQAEV